MRLFEKTSSCQRETNADVPFGEQTSVQSPARGIAARMALKCLPRKRRSDLEAALKDGKPTSVIEAVWAWARAIR